MYAKYVFSDWIFSLIYFDNFTPMYFDEFKTNKQESSMEQLEYTQSIYG